MAWRDWIKKFQSGDKEQIVADEARGVSVGAAPAVQDGSAVGGGDDGVSTLHSNLAVDTDLMRRYADYENMDDYPNTCLAGESSVFTLERGWTSIQELAESDAEFHVLAYDRSLRSLVPAKAAWAKLTGQKGHSKPMVRVTMDDGRSIRCTADHRFMTKDEKWVEAGKLSVGTSLMPGVLRLRSLNSEEQRPYWQVRQPHPDSAMKGSRKNGHSRWSWVHRLVMEYATEDVVDLSVHHINGNAFDNSPSNLEVVDNSEHAHHHIAALDNSKYFPKWTDEMRQDMSRRMRGNTYSRGVVKSEETREKLSGSLLGHSKSEEWRRKIGLSQPNRIDLSKEQIEGALEDGGNVAGAAKILGVSWSKAKRAAIGYDLLGDGGNHRVMKVERIDDDCPVYDISVPGYFNFVCNGVVVHNSEALDRYADDSTIPDTIHGKTIWGTSRDRVVRDIINDCIDRRIRLEEDIWVAVRTLCKYGNCFAEILINEVGVVGLNWLPVATMRRIVDEKGSLIGFVQDTSGVFNFNYNLAVKQMKGDHLPKVDEDEKKRVIFFRPWEVVHWRLRSKMMRAQYGYCLTGDSQVWTPNGSKRLDAVEVGDFVYTRHGGLLRSTRVLNTVCSGSKPIVKLKTVHREVRLTVEHPVLVQRGGGSEWAPVGELVKGDMIMAVSNWPETLPPPPLGIGLTGVDDDTRVTLSERGIDVLSFHVRPVRYAPRDWGVRSKAKAVGIDKSVVDSLMSGESGIRLGQLKDLFREVGVPFFDGVYKLSPGVRLNVPDLVDDKFARFFGFLIGDGWIHGNQVSFAMGVDGDQNEFYEKHFEEYGLSSQRARDGAGEDSQVVCGSTELIKVFSNLGWNGEKAKDKRIPGWLFAQSRPIRTAFLRGLMDADGWRASGKEHIELCNRSLVRDVKTLVDGLGWTCGNIRERGPRDSCIKTGVNAGNVIHSGEQYTVTFGDASLSDGDFVFEKVVSLESDGNELVYDIEVADRGHNFVADGVVVHNSVFDSARWVWKRLVMMEDTAMVQKLCLHGDSQIWTNEGRKAIRDLEEGDKVYSYTEKDELVEANVVLKKHNGKDRLYKVKSSHRELYANKTHPVLVETIVSNGSGRSRGRRVDYVEVQDLIPGVHRLMTPSKDNDLCEEIPLVMPDVGQKARLSKRAIDDGIKRNVGVKKLHDDFGMDVNYAKAFFRGEKWVVADTIERVMEANGTSLDYLDMKPDWGGVKELSLPTTATEDFARWFGFMIGDGHASERPFKKGDREYFVRTVGFACGSKDDVNQRYRSLFESFFGGANFCRDKRSSHECVGKCEISSKALYEFMILNGFVPGAHNKRVPGWVFRSPVSVRQAFLEGLADADAHIIDGSVSEERGRVRHERMVLEMCNRDLVEDVRELAMQTGLKVGSVIERTRKGGRSIGDSRFVLSDRNSYVLEWSLDRQPMSEVLRSVEEVETDDIWDIGVDSQEHNFVANGIVVHNTRAPGRYAFYVDTGDLPPREAMALVKKVKRGFKKTKLIDPSTGKLDFRFNPLCLAGDTEIPLLDGSKKSIVEMAQAFERGEEQWVYGVDRKNENRMVPGKVVWAGETRKDAELVRVTLDNGKSFRVTPDHKCILRSGDVKDAQDLIPGESLMPLRKTISSFEKDDSLDGYKKVKVASVDHLDEREDTYTLTVDSCHNFGVSAGVIVCNSPHEDFWVPTRGGKESTRIETVSGPDVQMMDDVEYFQGKLDRFLKIPKESDGESDRTLSHRDARFARACMRIQREFIMGVRKIIRLHMAALNIDPSSIEWKIKMTVPSAIFEMQQIEVMNAQAALASSMGEWVSKTWVLEHVFRFTEDDAAFAWREKNEEEDAQAKRDAGTQSDVMRMYPELQELPPIGDEPPVSESLLGGELIGLKKMMEEASQKTPEVVKRFERLESRLKAMEKSIKKRALSG